MSASREFVRVDMATPEGVEVLVRDETAAYGYRNIYTVRLRVRLRTPDAPIAHERVLERMGVYEEQVEAAKRELLDSFRNQIAPYLRHPEFASRLTEHLKRKGEQTTRGARY